MVLIRFWHRNRRHSWPVGQWRSEGMLGRILKVEQKVRKGIVRIGKKKMLGRILKVEKKVRKSVVRTLLGRLRLFGNGKTRLLFGRLWNAVIKWKWSTAKKVRSYSDNDTLSSLVHCSTDRWTISVFKNMFDNFFVIIGNGEINHTGIKCRGGQNHRQQIVAGEIFVQLSFVFLSSQIMPHFVTKFVYETFQVRFVFC